MKKILMYSGPMCNFCEAAKRLLERNKLKYKVVDISSEESLRDEMIKKSNGKRTINELLVSITINLQYLLKMIQFL